jgi:MarR family transcriptional regulator for hemolysin
MRFIRSQMRSHRKHSLSVPQFRALVFASVNRDPSLSAMAEHIGISLPTASRMVDLLVRRGLMERRSAAADRRRVSLSLTARGQAVFRSARRATQAALALRFRSMTPDERSQICAALQTLSRVFAGPRLPVAGD